MATRYFKSKDGHTVVSTSSGNRSKSIPGLPHNSFNYIEIERKEFYRLKRKILMGVHRAQISWSEDHPHPALSLRERGKAGRNANI